MDIASVRTDRRKRNSSQVGRRGESPRSKGRWNFSSDWKRGTDRSKSFDENVNELLAREGGVARNPPLFFHGHFSAFRPRE